MSDRLPKGKTSENWRHKAMGLGSPQKAMTTARLPNVQIGCDGLSL
jgi:hypothetical protein